MAPDLSENSMNSPIDKGITILIKSGVLFWLGGLIAWLYHHGYGPIDLIELINSTSKSVLIVTILSIIIIIAIISSILSRFDTVIIRILEGYYLPKWIIKWQNKIIERKQQRFQELAQKNYKGLPPLSRSEFAEYADLDWQLMYIPKLEQRLPTRLGNLLRAIESRPGEKYGLNIFICWPRLWLILPESVKTELTTARANLEATARIWLWGLLFLVWTIYSYWAIAISIITIILAYRWMLQAAATYGQLIESSFDLYRHELYKQLRWKLPSNAAEEKQQGKDLTSYLWRGSEDDKLKLI
ncbi:hypothetical protein [Candidatus Marithrix sp. Canyon 246]|uniref:hypothetical protein n=1 Tax=Candidatus Marithrix sp. Canyon 246 TaxID=1827136 RepID=UPI00084A0038|nr:hypothetical protein [Candidatus Marithrix sp. Canyon 246]